jgi:hypothetical protein
VNEAVKPVSVPQVAEKEKHNGVASALEEKLEKAKYEEPRGVLQEEKKKEEANVPTTEQPALAGDKRKADEVSDAKPAAGDEDQEAKKQKTTNGAPATDDTKKEPEKAKPAEKKARAPKKEKKVPRTGTSERKTRSQGAAPTLGL